MAALTPFLAQPDVHLALDPEFEDRPFALQLLGAIVDALVLGGYSDLANGNAQSAIEAFKAVTEARQAIRREKRR